jgi:hypothetical protein
MARSNDNAIYLKILCAVASALFPITCGLVVRYVSGVEAQITSIAADIKDHTKASENKHDNFQTRIGKLETCCEVLKRK